MKVVYKKQLHKHPLASPNQTPQRSIQSDSGGWSSSVSSSCETNSALSSRRSTLSSITNSVGKLGTLAYVSLELQKLQPNPVKGDILDSTLNAGGSI